MTRPGASDLTPTLAMRVERFPDRFVREYSMICRNVLMRCRREIDADDNGKGVVAVV